MGQSTGGRGGGEFLLQRGHNWAGLDVGGWGGGEGLKGGGEVVGKLLLIKQDPASYQGGRK